MPIAFFPVHSFGAAGISRRNQTFLWHFPDYCLFAFSTPPALSYFSRALFRHFKHFFFAAGTWPLSDFPCAASCRLCIFYDCQGLDINVLWSWPATAVLDQKLCFNMILRLCGNSKYVQLDWLRYVVPEIPNDPILRSDAPFSGLFSPNGIWAPLEFVFLENARLITVQLFDVLRADTPPCPRKRRSVATKSNFPIPYKKNAWKCGHKIRCRSIIISWVAWIYKRPNYRQIVLGKIWK